MDPAYIYTRRLNLIPMPPALMEALLAADPASAARMAGYAIPPEAEVPPETLQVRLKQLRQDPGLAPWLLRSLVLRDEQVMVGYASFHSRPGPRYLEQLVPGGVELSCTVFPVYRRQGFANEALRALMRWAFVEHGVRHFLACIPPEDPACTALARTLGFAKVTSRFNPQVGREDLVATCLADVPPL